MDISQKTELAEVLVHHSCAVKNGENVLIEAIGIPIEMVLVLTRVVAEAGGVPFVNIKDERVIRALGQTYTAEDVHVMADIELYQLQKMDAFIGIRGIQNLYEMSDINMHNLREYYIKPVHLVQRNEHTKWVFMRWPTPAMAQNAGMSTDSFFEYYLQACHVNYKRMAKAMKPLAELMQLTDHVRIQGPGDTDLSFSIQGMNQCEYAGTHNIPDGEIFTCPIRDSVNGRIQYNIPSPYGGNVFENVSLEFKNGRVIQSDANNPIALQQILDQDEGARFIGEFAFGFNPHINRPIKDILFDEKMTGSIHLAQGNAYRECDNGVRSSVHWDLILSQVPEKGGGRIYFDDCLVRKDGQFVLDELIPLNPENLI